MTILKTQYCGYVAIVGKPNVGKSTLLNQLVGQKLSIISRKAQTTRQQILGIKTDENLQVIYVDTPGIQNKHSSALNSYMNRQAKTILFDVDVIVLVLDRLIWQAEDEQILAEIKKAEVPVILAINKVDKLIDKSHMLPFIEKTKNLFEFASIIPISAQSGKNVDELEKLLIGYMPQQTFYFPDGSITNRGQAFFAAEIVREKLFHFLGDELPYQTTVLIESFKEDERIITIHALIVVQTIGQKKMVIGAAGEKIKQMGTRARLDLEKILEKKVNLKLWVKVSKNWSDDEKLLMQLGYE